MTEPDRLLHQVLEELRALRKTRGGVNVESIAHAPTICQLLGAGDPFVAFSRLRHQILESDFGPSIMAAAASLGLTVERDNLLDRLQAFGDENYLEQRQVRRYSDRGLDELSRMIVTNWPTETVPQFDLIVVLSSNLCELHMWTMCLNAVEMKTVQCLVLQGENLTDTELEWDTAVEGVWSRARLAQPVLIQLTSETTSIAVVWKGELWPKFSATVFGPIPRICYESLGNKLMVRIVE